MTTKSMMVRVGADAKDMDRALTAAQKRLEAFRGKINAIGRRMGVAAAAVTAAVGMMVKKYVEMGDWIDKMSKRTGFSATALSELSYAADITGASLSDVEKSTKRMARSIVEANEGLESYTRAFTMIGLEAKDLMGLKPEEQFMRIGGAIANLKDETEKAAVAQMIFGRTGTTLLPFFKEGSEGLERLRKEAHRLGIVFDQEAAAKAANLKDANTALKRAIQGLGFEIIEKFVPILTGMAEHFTDAFVNIRGNAETFTRSIIGFFKIIGQGIMGLGLAWTGTKAVIFKVAEYAGKVMNAQIAIMTAPLQLLKKIPGAVGEPARRMLDEIAKFTNTVNIVTEGYNETAEGHVNTMADMIEKYEAFAIALDNVANGFTRMSKKSGESTEELVETALPAARDIGKALEALGARHGEFTAVWETKSRELSKAEEAAMGAMMTAYGGSIESILDFFEKWAAAALIKWVMTTIPFPGNLLAAPLAMIALKALFKGIKSMETGGFVPKETLAHLHPGEFVVNAPTVRALKAAPPVPEPGLPSRYQFDITTIIGGERFYNQVVKNVNRAGELRDLKIPAAVVVRG